MHLHTFRHTFISNAITQGTPEAIVRDWVGHVDAEILKLYTHIASQSSQAAMLRLAEANTKQQAKMNVSETANDAGIDVAQTQHSEQEKENG